MDLGAHGRGLPQDY
jgi:hypothetical protein